MAFGLGGIFGFPVRLTGRPEERAGWLWDEALPAEAGGMVPEVPVAPAEAPEVRVARVLVAPVLPTLAVRPLSAVQAEGAGAFSFTVTRSGDVSGVGSVAWSVAGVAGNGTLPADAADFVGGELPSGLVSFAAGETQQVVTVAVAGDAAPESNERFAVTLSAPVGGVLGVPAAQGVILNDDAARYSIGPAERMVAEGSGGGTTTIGFTVTRAGTATGVQTVAWAVAPGGRAGTVAASAADFAGGVLPAGEVTFAPGQGAVSLSVAVAADVVVELNESFTVVLSGPSGGGTIGRGTAVGVILDDETIRVEGQDDFVFGTEGGDLFLISVGNHSVEGLGGADRYVFSAAVGAQPAAGPNPPANVTGLFDFDPDQGQVIDLSQIDAVFGTGANEAFVLRDAFTNTPGELVVRPDGRPAPISVVLGDINGDAVADFTVLLPFITTGQPQWFVL